MFTAVDWHALLTCPSQWKIRFFNKDSAALNVRNQMGISVLLRIEGEKLPARFKQFLFSLQGELCPNHREQLKCSSYKKLMSFSLSLHVNIFILLPLFPIYSKTVTACSRA